MNNIIICGKPYSIGTRVVTWKEGFNGYDTSRHVTRINNRKTGHIEQIVVKGKRYSKRTFIKPNFNKLTNLVSQFFLHHSGLYKPEDTFNVLHNQRRLSCHFILDDRGVLYQTLDLKEKAWHGGKNNKISIGLEIDSRANASRFPDAYDEYHCKKYNVLPRKKKIDYINNKWLWGYEYTDKQYETIIRLGITLIDIFPKIKPVFPDKPNRTLKQPLKHEGLICHFHNGTNKIDPISLDYERIVLGIKNKNPHQLSTFKELNIREQQKFLKYYTGKIDGLYGPKTKYAIQQFQREHNLVTDGVWGPKTNYMATEMK